MTATRTGIDLSTYLVTDTVLCGARRVPEVVAAAVRGGATCVQVREKTMPARDFLALVAAVVEVAGAVPVLVNDRLDVALAAHEQGVSVAGVHVGQSDLPAPVVRTLLWPGALLGLSVSLASEVVATNRWPGGMLDYLGVGPVYNTATKPGHDPSVGLVGAAQLATATGLPCVAIGGLSAQTAVPLRRAGLAGAAYVSAICAADDPESATRQLLDAWTG